MIPIEGSDHLLSSSRSRALVATGSARGSRVVRPGRTVPSKLRGQRPGWVSDCLDRDVVGVGGEGFDVCFVAGEDGAAGVCEGADDRVDC